MKPFDYFELLRKMPGKADKYDLRLRMVKSAIENGVRPTARLFATTPKTVRKWLNRYKQERLAGLNELPRAPHRCPHKTNATLGRRVVQMKRQYPFMGCKRLKREHNLACSHEAIRRILHEYGLIHKRRKKHKRKRDLAKIKKNWRQDRTRDGFEKVVEGFGSRHKRIPVRAWSYNSDVETVHSTIEDEFYDLENFETVKDFHQRVSSYQACYNLVRENSHKDNKSPWQIIKEIQPKTDPALAKLPALMLDWLGPDYVTKEEFLQRGYDLPCYPCLSRKRSGDHADGSGCVPTQSETSMRSRVFHNHILSCDCHRRLEIRTPAHWQPSAHKTEMSFTRQTYFKYSCFVR